MNLDPRVGPRFALWWVDALTRTAEAEVAADRRAEVASDVHEHMTSAQRSDAVLGGSLAVVSRAVRGMLSDVAWRVSLEVRPARFAWHLRNPSTAITSAFVVMFPVNLVADSAWPGDNQWLAAYRAPLWAATHLVAICILLFALTALATRVRPGWASSADTLRPLSRLEGARRCATATLGVTLAGSAVSRFGVLDPVSGVFWFAFGACVLAYAALLLLTISAWLLTLGRYLPKVRA